MIRKSYKAASLSEAVQMIRREMGPNAAILETKSHPAKKSLFKTLPPQIEVIAGVDERHLSRQQMESLNGKGGLLPASDGGIAAAKTLAAEILEKRGAGVSLNLSRDARPTERSLRDASLLHDKVCELESENARLRAELAALSQGRDELRAIRGALKAVALKKPEKKRGESALLNRDRWEILDWLVEGGLNEPLVMEWQKHIAALPMTTPFSELFDASISFFYARFLVPQGPLPRLLALVGPAKSGKTATALKLAAHLKAQGRRVAFVTLDGEDKAAAGAAHGFCTAMGIPFELVGPGRGLARTLKKFNDCDHVIFDTPSVARGDRASLKKLAAKLETFGTENFIIYGGGEADYLDVTALAAPLNAVGLVFSKLDRARRPGYHYNLMAETGLPACYFGIGPTVPEDIEPASAERLVSLLFKIDSGNTEDAVGKEAS